MCHFSGCFYDFVFVFSFRNYNYENEFGHILFWVYSAWLLYRFVSFTKFEKFSAIIFGKILSVPLTFSSPLGFPWCKWWIFCYCPKGSWSSVLYWYYYYSIFSLLFRVGKFYWYVFKSTDFIPCHLYSTTESVQQVFFSYCGYWIFQFYTFVFITKICRDFILSFVLREVVFECLRSFMTPALNSLSNDFNI